MYTLIAENKYGDKIELTHNPAYVITEIDGLYPPEANINTTHNAGYDGDVFNSSYVGERTVTITMAINDPAETNRIALYKYFKTKNYIKLYYANGLRDVYIEGYVQAMQISYFAMKEIAQIVVKCPYPFFSALAETDTGFATVNPLFEFPFEIVTPIPFSEILVNEDTNVINPGDVETGVIITINCNGNVTGPKIYNVDTGESFIIESTETFEQGDVIVINTLRGQKSVTKNGTGSVYYTADSSWFQLAPGDNTFTIDATDGVLNMEVIFSVVGRYEGV